MTKPTSKKTNKVKIKATLKSAKLKTSKKASAVEATPSGNAREVIMRAAAELFAEYGLHKVTTRDIANASKQNLSLISYYFGGKEKLYETIIREFADVVEGRIRQVVVEFDSEKASVSSLKTAMLNLIDAVVHLHLKSPFMVRIMGREKVDGLPYSKEIHERMFAQIGAHLRSIIEKSKKAEVAKKDLNSDFFIMSLMETMMANFMMPSCGIPEAKGRCYEMPTKLKELKEQLLLIYFEGILK